MPQKFSSWSSSNTSRRAVLKGMAAGGAAGSAALLVGCGDDDATAVPTSAVPSTAASTSAQPTPTAAPKPGGQFVSGQVSLAIDFFDVHQTTSAPLQSLAQYTHDGPMTLEESAPGDFQIKPLLVSKWEQADPTTLVLHVRNDVKFPNVSPFNGRALTAEDVAYSLERMATKKAEYPRSGWFKDVDRWEVLDGNTVKVTTSRPVASLTFLLAHPWTLVVGKEQAEKDGDRLKSLIGTGPYQATSIDIGNQATLTRNPNYWNTPKPYPDSWKFLAIADNSARMAAFRSGQLSYTDVPKDVLQSFASENPKAGQFQAPAVGIFLIGLNLRKPPYNDVRVRQAIANAVDLNGWIDVIMAGDALRTGPMSAAFRQWALTDDQIPYKKPDIKKAKELLSAAGLSSGFDMKTITWADNPRWWNQAVQMKEDLKPLGINVEIERVTTADYRRHLFTQRDFDVVNGADFAAEEPTNLADRYSSTGGLNWSGYANTTVDQLFEKQSVTLDAKERRSIMDQIQKTMLDEAATIFTMVQTLRYFTQPNVRQVRASGMSGASERWNARETYFTS